jgi:hypothetical protein
MWYGDSWESAMTKSRGAQLRKKTASVSQRRALVSKKPSKKRFKASSGKYAHVAVLDANTASFGSDLLEVFRENVAKARKENKRLFGSPDRAPERN